MFQITLENFDLAESTIKKSLHWVYDSDSWSMMTGQSQCQVINKWKLLVQCLIQVTEKKHLIMFWLQYLLNKTFFAKETQWMLNELKQASVTYLNYSNMQLFQQLVTDYYKS